VLPAVKNHTEDGDASLEYRRAPFWALLFFGLWGSERLIVDFGVGVVGVICARLVGRRKGRDSSDWDRQRREAKAK
jgi:hypothetical protein